MNLSAIEDDQAQQGEVGSMEPEPLSKIAQEKQEEVTTSNMSPNIGSISSRSRPIQYRKPCITCHDRHKKCSRQGPICDSCKKDCKTCVWHHEFETQAWEGSSSLLKLAVPSLEMSMSESADEDSIAMVVDKRWKSIDEEINRPLAEVFSTRDESLKLIRKPDLSLGRDTQEDTVAQKAPSEASRTHLRRQPHLSSESRSKAIGAAGIGQDTNLNMANDMAIDAQEIVTADNLHEKNDESGDTKNTNDLSLPQNTQPSSSSAPAPSTAGEDTPEPAAPAAAAILSPQLGRPRTAITAAATVTTTATATPPPPLFTCRYCPKQLLTARGMRQHEAISCKMNPGSTAAFRAALPTNAGTSQSTGAAAGAGAGAAAEIDPNAGIISSTSTAQQPFPALVLGAASSLPSPSASSLPKNSNASRAAPVPARLPGREQASPSPAGGYAQHQWEAHARSRGSQPRSQSQQPATGDVEDVPATQGITVDVLRTSHTQLQPQSQRRPHRRGNRRPDLVPDRRPTARPNSGQRQRTTPDARPRPRPRQPPTPTPTPTPLSPPTQPRPTRVPIHATFTTRAGQIFPLAALDARLNPAGAALQAEEEERVRRDNDLSLPGRLAKMGKMHEAERQRVWEQQLAACEAERLWAEREAELQRAGEEVLSEMERGWVVGGDEDIDFGGLGGGGGGKGVEGVEGAGEDDGRGVDETAEAEGGGVERRLEEAVEDIAGASVNESLGLADTQPSWETVLSPFPAEKTMTGEEARVEIDYSRELPEEDARGQTS